MLASEAAPLLVEVETILMRYVVLEEDEAFAIVLWVMHTHAFEASECTPYLSITSAEKGSGKTRLLEVLVHLVARPWFTGRVTAAVLVRKIDKDHPTLLLDESDAAFGSDKEYANTLRGVLNQGYRRGGKHSACVPSGKTFELRDFDVYSPKAIAGIGTLPDTVEDRSIPIRLRRKAPTETVERLRLRTAPNEFSPLQQRLESWGQAFVQKPRRDVTLPDELGDRAADCWEPLFEIAEAIGPAAAQRARLASVRLSGRSYREDESLGVRLLSDIRATFEEIGSDRISSAQLAELLSQREESPWGPRYGQPFGPRNVAKLLKPYGIKPKTIRDGEVTMKGYHRDDLADVWRFYLPSTPEQTVTSVTPSQTPPRSPRIVTDVTDVTRVQDGRIARFTSVSETLDEIIGSLRMPPD